MNHKFDKIDLLSFYTGDGNAAKRNAIEIHLGSCEHCRAYLASLDTEKTAFLSAHPFEEATAQRTIKRENRPLFFGYRQTYALAATLVLFLGAGYLFIAGRAMPQNRIKGETSLKIFVKNLQGDIEKRGTKTYLPGEKIQFLYSCAEKNNFALMSIDTTGAITTYFPQSQDSSLTLERGQDIPLPNSIVLDEYTGKESFIGIFSLERFYLPDMQARLKASFITSRSLDSISLATKTISAVSHILSIQREKRP
jgi:hypothetical protein